MNSALSLDCLQDDRAGLFIHKRTDRIEIVELCKPDTAHQRFERLLIVGIAGDGKGADRPAVEGMLHRNDLMVCMTIPKVGVLAGSLDRTLNGLCSGICEKHFGQPGVGDHLLCRLQQRPVVEQIGRVDDLVDLILQCLVIGFVSIAKRKDSNSGSEVEILLPVHIIKMHALSMVKYDRETIICVKDDLLGLFHDVL